ncbi:B3 domain-containing protein Os04g0386900 [Medicago truncatula]|uniref:B3 domain-containing protein Os04g0386900 n=1 Tax=Medicago truncatula TaxID=3880 RepID=UPI000D2F2392|nr:B3 domain-containing protein Os04g0386900 [Medicago truncatula]
MQTGGIEPLTGEPYFHVVLSKTHLSTRYGMGPSSSICEELPSKEVPTILKYRGKSWGMTYNGQNKTKQFDSVSWEKFAEDNYLKLGDACVFELMKNSEEEIVFKVQILRGEEEPILLSEFPGTGMFGLYLNFGEWNDAMIHYFGLTKRDAMERIFIDPFCSTLLEWNRYPHYT